VARGDPQAREAAGRRPAALPQVRRGLPDDGPEAARRVPVAAVPLMVTVPDDELDVEASVELPAPVLDRLLVFPAEVLRG